MTEFRPSVTTDLRNSDMSKMRDVFLAWVEKTFPGATEKQKTQITFHAIRIYWMLDDWDRMPATPTPQQNCGHEQQDLKAIGDFVYSTMNHTPEWEKAEQAFQNILTSRLTADVVLDELDAWCSKEETDADEQGDYVVQSIFCQVKREIFSLRRQLGGQG